jgi:hypothetical protein
MSGRFLRSARMTCAALRSATSSLGLGAGHTRCVLLASATTPRSGLDHHPVSPSARQVNKKEKTMNDTSPRISQASSPQDGLLFSSESKSQARLCSERLQNALEKALMERLSGRGSMIYQGAWKPHITPSERQIYRLRASARRTSGSEPSLALSGWPTPQARDTFPAHSEEYIAAKKAQGHGMANLNDHVQMSGWMTPQARDWKGPQGRAYKGGAKDLPMQGVLSGWPTPQAGNSGSATYNQAGNTDFSRKTEALVGKDVAGHNIPDLTAWDQNGPARITADGTLLTGFSAGMESGGQLNPAHSRWLMGYPPEWDDCAVTAMPSSRKLPRSS